MGGWPRWSRIDLARAWVDGQLPAEDRTRVRKHPDTDRIEQLSQREREAVKLLLDGLDKYWSMEGLTQLVYGIPKTQVGLPIDAAPPRS